MICMVSLLYSMLACHTILQEASIADYRGPWIPLCLVIDCTEVCHIRHRTGYALTVYSLLNTIHGAYN
jgi:hypothetical protein